MLYPIPLEVFMAKLNKAEKIVKRLIENRPLKVESTFEIHFYVFRQIVDMFQLESGYADVPDKNMPIEYQNAITKYAPET